jgi:hypothetical protein
MNHDNSFGAYVLPIFVYSFIADDNFISWKNVFILKGQSADVHSMNWYAKGAVNDKKSNGFMHLLKTKIHCCGILYIGTAFSNWVSNLIV